MNYAWIKGSFLSGQKLTYHSAPFGRWNGRPEMRTGCGMVRYAGLTPTGTHVEEVLAARIAKPCLRCYPERRVP